MVQAPHPYGSRHPRLLDQVREVIRIKRYSIRTEEAYTHMLRRGGHGVRRPFDES